jgi:purine-binding chemotaxis protein CheW
MSNSEKTKKTTGAKSGSYLLFEMDGNDVGVDVMDIRGVIALKNMEIPTDMPEHLRGVTNVMGKEIPVYDLSALFAKKPATLDKRTCVLITEHENERKKEHLGIVAESIKDVHKLRLSQNASENHTEIDSKYIEGIDDNGVIALRLDRIISDTKDKKAA